jgi:hypothetical protein
MSRMTSGSLMILLNRSPVADSTVLRFVAMMSVINRDLEVEELWDHDAVQKPGTRETT